VEREGFENYYTVNYRDCEGVAVNSGIVEIATIRAQNRWKQGHSRKILNS
jgi:hypothetical protein